MVRPRPDMVYAFNHEEAVACFERAAAADPGSAIAHWGIAYALGPNYNKPWRFFDEADLRATVELTHEAVARARTLQGGVAPVEHALIEALARRYSAADAEVEAGGRVLGVEHEIRSRDGRRPSGLSGRPRRRDPLRGRTHAADAPGSCGISGRASRRRARALPRRRPSWTPPSPRRRVGTIPGCCTCTSTCGRCRRRRSGRWRWQTGCAAWRQTPRTSSTCPPTSMSSAGTTDGWWPRTWTRSPRMSVSSPSAGR
jgi:hypothetical protein